MPWQRRKLQGGSGRRAGSQGLAEGNAKTNTWRIRLDEQDGDACGKCPQRVSINIQARNE